MQKRSSARDSNQSGSAVYVLTYNYYSVILVLVIQTNTECRFVLLVRLTVFPSALNAPSVNIIPTSFLDT